MALLLNCQSLSKSFGARPLFESLSLTISEGDRLGLIGPNGSGKTTLLQIMAGGQQPDAGTLSQRKLLRVGYVAQDSVFPDGPTVRQVLVEALAPLHIDEMEAKAKVATILGIAGF
ncbi:MAG: ABC-F family ATP-binding cassette domain-containing protein, partial [Acidobacteriia bacterium]|nr:ABC-F family ATP-binding cassette domain-containing protein [Terriglobia bacterium]